MSRASKISSDMVPINSNLNIEWTKMEMGLRRFMEIYETSIPLLLHVTEGYLSVDDLFVFSAGDIYWVKEVFRLRRVIVTDSNGLKISIPIDYNLNFIAIWPSREKSPPMKLKNIIELWNTSPGGLDIVLEDNAFVTFMVGVDNQTQTQLGRLQIEDVYDETYLLAHSIISGCMHSHKMLIPLFAKIKVTVAKGLLSEEAENFSTTIRKIDRCCALLPPKPVDLEAVMKIMQLAEGDHDYTYVEPALYYKPSQVARNIVSAQPNTKVETPRYVTANSPSVKNAPHTISFPKTQAHPIFPRRNSVNDSNLKSKPLPPLPTNQNSSVEPQLSEVKPTFLNTRHNSYPHEFNVPARKEAPAPPITVRTMDSSMSAEFKKNSSTAYHSEIVQNDDNNSEEDYEDIEAEVQNHVSRVTQKCTAPYSTTKENAVEKKFNNDQNINQSGRSVSTDEPVGLAYELALAIRNRSMKMDEATAKVNALNISNDSHANLPKRPEIYQNENIVSRRGVPPVKQLDTKQIDAKITEKSELYTQPVRARISTYELTTPVKDQNKSHQSEDVYREVTKPAIISENSSISQKATSPLQKTSQWSNSPRSPPIAPKPNTEEQNVIDSAGKLKQRVAPLQIVTTPQKDEKLVYGSLNDVPKNIAGMTITQVSSVVNCLFPQHPEYANELLKKEIDGDILIELDKNILINECGFTSIDAIKLVKFVREAWRPNK